MASLWYCLILGAYKKTMSKDLHVAKHKAATIQRIQRIDADIIISKNSSKTFIYHPQSSRSYSTKFNSCFFNMDQTNIFSKANLCCLISFKFIAKHTFLI